ncbi:MAG: TerB family tellurite resistance protein [Rhodobacterales bacterium]|nr:TerB family tellurite resistance protein [Rhodobacterales bacterium]
MFADLLARLSGANTTPLPATDARLALTALLVRAARSDNDYSTVEIARIDAITRARYDLSQEAAETLRADAETLETEAPDTVRFTRDIKNAVPFEDRVAVIESLWQVVLADGSRDKHENALLRLVANLLGVNDRDSALARQRVETR